MHWYNSKNINYFGNHFAVSFTVTPEEEKNNTVTVIPKSHPKAIAEASVTNATMSLTIALAEHDCDSYQVGGTLPVTKEVHKAFTTGHAWSMLYNHELELFQWYQHNSKLSQVQNIFVPFST